MRALLSVLSAGLLLLVLPRPARPCAIATRSGERVEVADETAIIVWDEARKVEHFIRTVSFTTSDVGPFGFLVPSPSRPELGEVPLTVFSQLHRAVTTAREDRGISLGLTCVTFPLMGMGKKSKSVDRDDPVRVLERTSVAGYDVAVLESDSAAALADWLTSHSFSSRPQLAEWLAPYVAARWKLTAFRFRGSGEATTPTAAVRMSFAAGRPFFPYREPSDAAPTLLPWRTLRVHLIGGRKMEGSLTMTEWPAAAARGPVSWSTPASCPAWPPCCATRSPTAPCPSDRGSCRSSIHRSGGRRASSTSRRLVMVSR